MSVSLGLIIARLNLEKLYRDRDNGRNPRRSPHIERPIAWREQCLAVAEKYDDKWPRWSGQIPPHLIPGSRAFLKKTGAWVTIDSLENPVNTDPSKGPMRGEDYFINIEGDDSRGYLPCDFSQRGPQ